MADTATGLKTLKIYTGYWRRYPLRFAGCLLMGPAYALQVIISPLFIAKALGQLVNHQPISTAYLWYAALAMVGGTVLQHIADRGFTMPLCIVVTRDLYNVTLKHLMRQEYGFFANSFGGSLVAQANRFSKGYEAFNDVVFLESLGLLCGVLVALGIMIYYNPLLGVAVTLLWAISIAIVAYLAIRRMPIRRAAVAKESQQTGELADIITNAVTVKTFAQESEEERRYDLTNKERSDRYHRSWSIAIRNGFAINILCIALQLLVFIGGILAVKHGTLSIAMFLLFQVYILRVIDSLGKASLVVRKLEGTLGDTQEMTELLSRQSQIVDPEQPEPSRIKKGAIDLHDVTFGYDLHDKNSAALLKDFSLHITPGERVGLVGPSGGGKTTLTKLLLRFNDVQDGAITIDGQDIRAIKQDDLHNAISYVPQEPLLFHRTIKENIGYGDTSVNDDAIIKAAKQAHAHKFITSLPNGYDTLVGERGIKLSGGQRQRIAIARAMIKKAPILVLDEATSALDSESEVYIQDGLWKLMQGKTALVIAHRLSTIQKMDRIIVLDNGRIIEEGTHKQLVAKKGLYARLWAHQSGGFIDD